MIWAILSIILGINVIAIGSRVAEIQSYKGGVIVGVIGGMGLLLGTITIIDTYNTPKPALIDVCLGNKIIQITYQDSIPIDTIVVFKPEIK